MDQKQFLDSLFATMQTSKCIVLNDRDLLKKNISHKIICYVFTRSDKSLVLPCNKTTFGKIRRN